MILVNFKVYPEATGKKGIELAKICRMVGEKYKVEIYPVVRALEAYRVKNEAEVEVYLQEFVEETGGLGIKGSLLNHSDHRLKPGTIRKVLKSWPKGLESVVCLSTWGQMEKWGRKLKPSYFAYEPKELIGNREKSVSSEYSEVIKKMVELVAPIPLLVGAGIHCGEDVRIALRAGAKGILVATDVVKADNPEKELEELAAAFSV
ncbi:hypothetical protein A3K55_02590 [Candidatus Shapirobacteria bacterium RBG_13_44_7]|uniref:Uncharacterized protein n=1 Tax=Candidatus Shapirobacteria bacterium RBG_13_44_7 TaxID=1802149 RepID=A0A1F7SK00_9BACT|nr:MAG: hypothetical protein A3K55_02590 [Candidatus Shapirobacteria bacterium RBG_13_44_7]